MSYLDGFMRGNSPDYSQNPGILGLYQFVQQGYNAGMARGQNQALSQLSQKAYTDTGDAQKQDISQAIGINPQAGYALAGQAQEQQAQQQAQKLAAFQRLGKAASAIIQAKQSGDETTAEGIYQAIIPELGLMSAQHGGPTPPPTLQGADMGALYKVAAMYASLPQEQKGIVVGAGGAVVNPSTGAQMYRNPYGLRYETVPNGTGTAAGAFDPNTGTVRPAVGQQQAPQAQAATPTTQGSAPQGAAQAPTGANVQFAFAPGTDPAVIAGTKAAAGVIDGAPQAASARFGIGTKAAGGDKPPSGYQWNADHTALAPIPFGPADKSRAYQGDSSASLFGDPSLTGPAYLKSIPQGNQEIVRGLLDGTVSLPTGTTLKSPLWQSALASVKHADPSWNQAAFKQYADTRKWATINQGGQLINNINTASQHLDKLREDIAALDNGNSRPLTFLENQVSAYTGGQAVTNFNADLTPVASELAAIYKGKGVPSDQEIAHFRDALTPNMSYGQQMNVIRGWISLLAGKLNATRDQYRSSMSKLSSPLSVINPHAAEALERITTMANQVSNTGQHAMPQQDTTPIYAPGGQQPAPAAGGAPQAAPTGVDALLSKYGVQ